MIHKIEVEENAVEVVKRLVERYPWRFKQVLPGEATMDFNFYDDVGYEYRRWIYFRASKDNRHIIVYVNKKDFPSFYRELADDAVLWMLEDYLK